MQLTPSDAPSLSVYPPWGLSLGEILLRLFAGDYLASGCSCPTLAKVFGCRMQCVQHYVTASNIALGLRHCEPCSGFHCLDRRITLIPVDMTAAFDLSLRLVLSLLSHHDRGSTATSHLMTMQLTPSDALHSVFTHPRVCRQVRYYFAFGGLFTVHFSGVIVRILSRTMASLPRIFRYLEARQPHPSQGGRGVF